MRLSKSDDYQPLAWVGRYPVYASTMIVGLHVITAILVAILVTLGQGAIFSHLYFSSEAVKGHFEIWQFVTYAFVSFPSVWFLIEMAMLYWFGRQVELFIGRRDFLALYGFLLVLPPCALMAAGAFSPVMYAGSSTLDFSIFLAFACLYPDAEIFFTIKAKWVAGALLAIYWLQNLANHQWIELLVLSLSALTAFLFIGRLRYGFEFPSLGRLKIWLVPKPPLVPPSRKGPETERHEDLLLTVDSLLEKITRQGIGSLTDKERQQLARASDELKRRERTSSSSRR